jgi:LytR cell envelope-related transcriptional attenuator
VEFSAPSSHPSGFAPVRSAHISRARPSDELGKWRTATIIACGVAAFELVLLLIVAVALLSKPLTAQAKEAALNREVGSAIPSRPEPKRATLSRRETSVLVLNGNGISGAAAAEASRARARGYLVAGTGNAPRSYGRTVVMYRPGHRPEAKRLAADIGVALVGPLDGIGPRQLQGAQVVVVLGT